VTPIWKLNVIVLHIENHLEQDINVPRRKIEQRQDIGLVKLGDD
jgi:hypothetical protein